MFRHKTKKQTTDDSKQKSEDNKEKIEKEKKEDEKEIETPISSQPVALPDIKELLEKNLKWSQILYEQNRKINRKLFWYSFAGWMRLLLIVIPIIIAIFYLPPILGQLWDQYGNVLGLVKPGGQPGVVDSETVINLINGLNLGDAQLDQIKGLIK